jgi:hypothetical protein
MLGDKMRKLLFILLMLACASNVYAQGGTYHWGDSPCRIWYESPDGYIAGHNLAERFPTYDFTGEDAGAGICRSGWPVSPGLNGRPDIFEDEPISCGNHVGTAARIALITPGTWQTASISGFRYWDGVRWTTPTQYPAGQRNFVSFFWNTAGYLTASEYQEYLDFIATYDVYVMNAGEPLPDEEIECTSAGFLFRRIFKVD